MELHSLLFEQGNDYERMANVLHRSVLAHSPNTPLTIHIKKINSDIRTKGRNRDSTFVDNATKSLYFSDLVQKFNNGQVVGLLDCDTMVINPLESIEKEKFDIAVTWRPPKSKLVFNSGVVFARISKRVKDFYREWAAVALEMLEDRSFFEKWRGPFGGINQTSFGFMMEQKEWKKVKILKLPCEEWNCENCTWHLFDKKKTRIVHLLGSLRHLVLRHEFRGVTLEKQTISRMWHNFDKPKGYK